MKKNIKALNIDWANCRCILQDRVKIAIAEHFNVDSNALYLTYPTFFSELTSLPAQTPHDEYWHDHIDKEGWTHEI